MADDKKNGLKILVVDDEPLVCDAVRMLLTIDGHNVETAPDGQAALAMYAPGKYDLILLDYEMPGMKGDEVAAALNGLCPSQPILLLTAHGDMLRSSGRSLPGVKLIVDKPFQLAVLREGIKSVMTKSKAG